MSLRDYDVNRDKFEADEWGTMVFPCCACKHGKKRDTDEPCRTCDHNVNAVKDTANSLLDRSDLSNTDHHPATCDRCGATVTHEQHDRHECAGKGER
jgi:hypothetical protein